jgi:DNA-binding MarR family transcriptional regulator
MPLKNDRVHALDRVLELAVLINADMSRGLAERGLTESRTHLLWELHQRGPSTQRELADALQVSARNITGLVDALSDTGFVTRQPHPTDRRATLVHFSDRGREVARTLEREQKEFARLLFDAMPDKQFNGFVKGLDTVLHRLRQLVAAEDKESTDD